MDKNVFIIIGIVVAVGLIFWGVASQVKVNGDTSVSELPSGIVLFYGQECPHCKVVDDYITQNKVEEKVDFTRMEVWHDQANANLLGKIALETCKMQKDEVGVPFLYDGSSKCLVGEDDVIAYFKDKAGIQ